MVSDADSGKVVQTLEIGPGPDGCIYDAGRKLVFSSNVGDGTVTILRETTPGHSEVAANIKTEVSAKTMAMDPKTGRLYLSAATIDEKAPVAKTKEGSRRPFVPGSLGIIIVGG